MAVESTDISVRRKGHGAGIEYDGQEFVRELSIGLAHRRETGCGASTAP